MKNTPQDIDKLRIHFIYWMIILMMVIIAIATDRWTSQKGFTEYLTNAATMTSLMLALVAIFYSFVSNSALSENFNDISSVANEVRLSKEQISKYLDLTTTSTEAARENTKAMELVSGDVKAALATLGETLSALKEQSEGLTSSVATLPTRLDQLEMKVIDATKSVGEKKNPPPPPTGSEEPSANAVDRFLSITPVTINLLSYACVLAKNTGKTLSLSAFAEATIDNADTYRGAIECMHGIGLIRRTAIKDQRLIYKLEAVHNRLATHAKSYITEYLKSSFTDKPEVRDFWREKMKAVEAIFA